MPTLGEVFKNLPSQWAGVRVADVYPARKSVPKIYAFILMACIREQVLFLQKLWGPRYSDDVAATVFAWLCRAGLFPDLMEPKTPEAQNLYTAVYTVVDGVRRNHLVSLDEPSPVSEQ